MNTLSKLQAYTGGRKSLLPGALVLSAMSSLMGMLPLIFIWLIVRELFKSQAESSQELINTYAWWAMGTALGGVCVYFLALMLSHLAAFRVETNMRRQAMQKIVKLPDDYEKNLTRGELMTGVLVNGAQSLLKLGLASVINHRGPLIING